jgi:hypothetical protein
MTALRPDICVEVSCRNDAGAGVGHRVMVVEWRDPRRVMHGRAAVPVAQVASHLVRLSGSEGQVTVRVLGEGTVQRVIQWLRDDGEEGVHRPARVVVQLDTTS